MKLYRVKLSMVLHVKSDRQDRVEELLWRDVSDQLAHGGEELYEWLEIESIKEVKEK